MKLFLFIVWRMLRTAFIKLWTVIENNDLKQIYRCWKCADVIVTPILW
jgi:hypothetical protein